ncbi:MAG: hypothetical protein N2746_00830 [Deltaproteobacteria bacterium]|nr:hypothetical protein [Deltaproteobacteria bacterium]
MSARILKNMVSLLIVICIFTSAFYLGGGFKLLIADKNQDISHPKISKEIPQYKDKSFFPMGDKIYVNNLPIQLGYFTTKDELTTVKDDLIKKFQDLGLHPHYTQVSDNEGFINAIDTTTGENKIIILKRTDNETLVFAGIAPILSNNIITKPDGALGIPPDAMNYIEVKTQDYGRYTRTISFQMKGSKEKNTILYKERLKNLGYEENDYLKKFGDEDVASLSKDNIQLMIVITEDKDELGETLTTFVLNVMERKNEKD